MPGPLEIILILVVILILFGGSRLPQLMKGMGQGVREFRKEIKPEDEQRREQGGQPRQE